MTSHDRLRRCEDDALDVLFRQALRARVAGARSAKRGRQDLNARIAAMALAAPGQPGAGLTTWRELVAWCLATLDRVLPLIELPTGYWSDQRTAHNNLHWKCLHLHRVTVRLLG